MMPLREISPTVGLIVATALLRAGGNKRTVGFRTDGKRHKLAATATAEPELLPDGIQLRIIGIDDLTAARAEPRRHLPLPGYPIREFRKTGFTENDGSCLLQAAHDFGVLGCVKISQGLPNRPWCASYRPC